MSIDEIIQSMKQNPEETKEMLNNLQIITSKFKERITGLPLSEHGHGEVLYPVIF